MTTTNNTYFDRLNNWKDRYAKVSSAIRQTRQEIKEAFRANEMSKAANAQRTREYLRAAARQMMEEREELREEARAYWARREAQRATERLLAS